MLRIIDEDSTDQSVVIRIVDSAAGTPEQAVDSSTTGLALWYRREAGAKADITPISDLASGTAAHSDGGIIHIDDGYYRVDVPDAAFANGADGVLVAGAATGMVVQGAYCQIRDAETEWNNIADYMLKRGLSNVEDSAGAYSAASAFLKVLKVVVSGGNLVWYKTNGSTQFASQSVTTDSDADPITSLGTPST